LTHILVTNDDGVQSPGLLAMKQALEPYGRVSVIAPDSNRSAIGRGITIHQPLHVEEVRLADGSEALATDGTPVDCVRFATLGLLDERPDVIVSGVNLGLNLGDDVTYSGTVAAALEGLLLGWPAIAVSAQAIDQEAGQWDGTAYDFRAAAGFAARLVPLVSRQGFPRRVLVNVNAPGLPPERIAGARVCRLGRRVYNDELTLVSTEGNRRRYTIYGGSASHQPEAGTDFEAIEAGAIAVTPMHFDLTDIDGMDRLERLSLTDLLEQDQAVERA
jgi:5'/3'-nucleotidase